MLFRVGAAVITSSVRRLRAWGFRYVFLPIAWKRSVGIYCSVIVVATGVMIPRLLSANFGLLDDGVTIYVSAALLQELKAGNWGYVLSIESDRGRFKPLLLLFFSLPYAISGVSPVGFFVWQGLSLALTGIVICKIVEVLTRDILAGLLSSILYLLSSPIFENYYTLSKGEPPMVLWIAISLLLLYKSIDIPDHNHKHRHLLLAASAFFLTMAYFTKETAHAMLLVSGLWTIGSFWQRRSSRRHRVFESKYKYFIINVVIVGLYWGTRLVVGTAGIASGEDSGNYQFALKNISVSVLRYVNWYFHDFFYIVPICLFFAFVIVRAKRRDSFSEKLSIWDGILWIVGWTAIMLPWHSALEYYLLPVAFGISIMTGILVRTVSKYLYDSSILIRLFAGVTLLSTLLISSICLINGFTNGRIQISVDSMNVHLVDYLALNVPQNGVLLVNLPEPNEYVFEIGVHLAVLKQRPDIRVRYFNSLNLPADSGAWIVTPIMQNQLQPSVRIAVDEGGARTWQSELHATLGDRATLVDHRVAKVRLFTVAVETTICPWLMRAHMQDAVFCAVKKPAIDRRVFRYGWAVYRI